MNIDLSEDDINAIKSQAFSKAEILFAILICIAAFIASEIGLSYEIRWIEKSGFTIYMMTIMAMISRWSSQKRLRSLINKVSDLTSR